MDDNVQIQNTFQQVWMIGLKVQRIVLSSMDDNVCTWSSVDESAEGGTYFSKYWWWYLMMEYIYPSIDYFIWGYSEFLQLILNYYVYSHNKFHKYF